MKTFMVIGTLGLLAFITAPASLGRAAETRCSPAGLQAEMAAIAEAAHGPVGAAVQIAEGGGPVIYLHGGQRFPMQSVYKLPIAMAVLSQVDAGTLTLSQSVPTDRGGQDTVSALLGAMMTVSDNAASDALLRLAGGPARVTAILRRLGVQNMVVATSEREMAQGELVQYRNWATPGAMASLLRALQSGRGLSPSSRRLLLDLMAASTTGPGRLKGLLPTGTVVAHKTGSSGTVDGLTRATNDAGLVTLPDGRHLIVAVFVSDTRADEKTREAVIAKIARAAWDCRAALSE